MTFILSVVFIFFIISYRYSVQLLLAKYAAVDKVCRIV